MVEYLSGNRIQGSSILTSAPPQTSWKELGRTTLGSTGDTIDVSSFAAKDNLMILGHRIQSGACNMLFRFNADSGSNYASRHSHNGGTDSTSTSQTSSTAIMSGDSSDAFAVQYVTNITNQEKLVLSNSITQSATGAGTAPNRREKIYKWANTSNAITSVNCFNDESGGDYAVGSEVVVLGYDNDEADSGTNFWQELASVDLSSGADEISTGTIASKKYIMWNYHVLSSGATNGLDNISFRFNNDSGNNYCYRHNDNGGSDGTVTNNSKLRFRSGGATAQDFFGSGYIINKSDKEKLLISEQVYNGGDGAGNAPNRAEMVGKWTNTSAQITEIDLIQDGAGSFLTGSYLQVFGAD